MDYNQGNNALKKEALIYSLNKGDGSQDDSYELDEVDAERFVHNPPENDKLDMFSSKFISEEK